MTPRPDAESRMDVEADTYNNGLAKRHLVTEDQDEHLPDTRPHSINDQLTQAQTEAEAELEALLQATPEEKDARAHLAPALLMGGGDLTEDDRRKATAELAQTTDKGRLAQLTQLLSKAEAYAQFISQNQNETADSRDIVDEDEDEEPAAAPMASVGSKRKGTPTKTPGSGKKTRACAPGRPKKDSGGAAALDAAAGKMAHAKAAAKAEGGFGQPPNLTGGKLKRYQLEGLRWLVTLYENGLSGILADEMGLGKTIQVVALFAYLRHKGVPGPFIVTAPLATLPNWVLEFRRWVPSLEVVQYHGSREERQRIRDEQMPTSKAADADFPVVVTSYEIALIDRPHLQRFNWTYLVIDEGQRIKNTNCRLIRELKQIPADSRLLLSGTPIQNTLDELWSLLNFANPDIFDSIETFRSWFGFKNIGKDVSVDQIIEGEMRERVVSSLHKILRPFLLRRLKRDVLKNELPPKREIVVYAGMSSLQHDFYQLVNQGKLRDALMTMGVEDAGNLSQINANMNQRKVCQHPFLFGEPRDRETGEYIGVSRPDILIQASGKLALLDRMLTRLHKAGHKVLIFSQMTRLLSLLEDYLVYRNWQYCRLDGSCAVNDRQANIESFNRDPNIFVFLLSTRAGGLGINLTAADTVVLFDSDWNPHQDSQAQDRCHRIGQTKPVVVYRLLTTGSVEIDMMEKQVSKKKLERMTVQGGDFRKAGRRAHKELTADELRKLLADDVANLHTRAPGTEVQEGEAIADQDLEMIMDRDRIFAEEGGALSGSMRKVEPKKQSPRGKKGKGSPEPLPPKGDWYDVVVVNYDEEDNLLDSIADSSGAA